MIKELIPSYDSLSLDEKLQLAEELWDQVGKEFDALPTPEWVKERLREDYQDWVKNPHDVVPWEEARARIEQTLALHCKTLAPVKT